MAPLRRGGGPLLRSPPTVAYLTAEKLEMLDDRVREKIEDAFHQIDLASAGRDDEGLFAAAREWLFRDLMTLAKLRIVEAVEAAQGA